MSDVDAAAKYLAEKVMRYAWNGLRTDGRCAPYPAFTVGGHANAHQEDYRDAVREILKSAGVDSEIDRLREVLRDSLFRKKTDAEIHEILYPGALATVPPSRSSLSNSPETPQKSKETRAGRRKPLRIYTQGHSAPRI